MRYYQYDSNGNLVSTDDAPAPSTGTGGTGSGTPGAAGKDGSIFYFVNYTPTPGQTVTGYNPQDVLVDPNGTQYPLQSA